MSQVARLINRRGAVIKLRVRDDFPMAHLLQGDCSGCAGTGRREFGIPANHPRRIAELDARDCHDCAGTGKQCAHIDSRIGRRALAEFLAGKDRD